MSRIVKGPDERRNEILDAAQGLFYTQGYEQTSIQEIIESVGIAKGTFYHHFGSKGELLDAMITRILDQALPIIEPIVEDEQLSALEKLQRFFADAVTFKLDNEALIRPLLKAWFADENAIMREKMKAETLRVTAPQLRKIIRQGVAEGSFATRYPDEIGEVVLQIGQDLSQSLAELLLTAGRDAVGFETIERKVAVYEDAITRTLGAPAGSVKIVDIESFQHWSGE